MTKQYNRQNVIACKRAAAGLSQEELAYMADISLRQLQSIEQGTRKPGLEALLKLQKILRCPLSYLIDPVQDELRSLVSAYENTLMLHPEELSY